VHWHRQIKSCVGGVTASVTGDPAVVVAVSAAHRGEALDACHRLIDDLKGTVPIWKHQRFADGTTEWVGVDLEAAEPGGAPTLVP
jgi:molybdopterin synthase catalytic subunit